MNEDKINQLVADVAVIKERLGSFINAESKQIQDHEKRIRSLEAFKFKIIGVVAASSVFGGIAGAVIQFLFK